MKRLAFFILFIITIFIFKEQASAQSFSILHSFGSSSDDGQYPFDNVILSGNTSYGMTINGGANNLGTIFKVNKDGSDYSVLHSFEGDASDGSNPRGTLLLSDGILYGMTNSNNGAIFKLNTDGSGFTILHSFSRSVDDGRNPAGTLIISDGVLYGTTYLSNNYGTVFSIKTDGSRFSILHNFTGMPDDGSYPTGSLLLSDNTLYGTTMNGGTSDNGTIFKINIDGNGYTQLHSFKGSPDGSGPQGSLIIDNGILYGLTAWGGKDGYGSAFSLRTDGSDYKLIRSFNYENDGAYPYGSFILSNGILYGTAYNGGNYGMGTLFGLEENGKNIYILHSFSGGTNDGIYPGYGSLVISNDKFFGCTSYGGESGYGTVYSLVPLKILTGLKPPTAINNSSASVDGSNIAYGSVEINSHGFCWNTTGLPVITDNQLTVSGTASTFSGTLTGLDPGTQYHVRAYATCADETDYSNEIDFWTLSDEPASHSNAFTAYPAIHSISLSFQAAQEISDCSGYIILRSDGTTPPDGSFFIEGIDPYSQALPDGVTIISIVTDLTAETYTDEGLIPVSNYSYSIVPFNWNGTYSETYNFKTGGTIPTLTAKTLKNGEPSEYPADFILMYRSENDLGLRWNESAGTYTPEGYLIKGSDVGYDAIEPPVDGIPEDDGTFIANIPPGYGLVYFGGLVNGKKYYFKIWPYSNSGSDIDYKTDGTAPHVEAPEYCEPNFYYPVYDYIQEFIFNGIDNASNTWGLSDGYSDYTNIISNSCFVGQTYNFQVYGYGSWSETSGLIIWVDWDNSGNFTQVFNSSPYVLGRTISGSLTIPTSAATGNHRMRIVYFYAPFGYFYNNFDNPCNSGYSGEIEDYTLHIGALPSVITVTAYDITLTNASSGGEVTNDGGSTISARGVCWNTTGSPVITDAHTTDGSGTGTFTSSLTGLSCDIIYHVRAYATNSDGTAYGEETTFTTKSLTDAPTIQASNIAINNVRQNTLTISWTNGNGSKRILLRKTSAFDDSDNPVDGTLYTSGNTIGGAVVAGVFSGTTTTADITGLSINTDYNFKMFEYNENSCSNSQGYKTDGFGSGNPVSVKTLPEHPTDLLPDNGEIFVGNSDSHLLTVYNTKDYGNVAPKRHISQSGGGLWFGGLTIYLNYIFIADNLPGFQTDFIPTYDVNTSGDFSTYNSYPFGPQPSGLNGPTGISFDKSGILYINNLGTPPFINIYDNTGLIRQIKGSNTGLNSPQGIAVDDNYIYVANYNTSQIIIYNKTDNGNITPVRVIGGSNTYISAPIGISVDKGLIYICASNRILVFHSNDNGNVTPLRKIMGSNTGFNVSCGISISGDYLFVTNWNSYSIFAFNNTDNGNIAPLWTISGSNTQLRTPNCIYVKGCENPPALALHSVTDISYSYATGNVEVTGDGGGTISARGLCWNRTGSPDITSDTTREAGELGTFSSKMTDLYIATKYYVRAYAKNDAGITYSNEISFTTLGDLKAETDDIYEITNTTAKCDAIISSESGCSVTGRGICWNTTGRPVISENHTSDGSGLGFFTGTITGLSCGTTYIARTYATNSDGIAYGDEESFTTTIINDAPSVQVQNLYINNVRQNSLTIFWENGDGQKRILLKKTTPFESSEIPEDGTQYSAGNTIGDAVIVGIFSGTTISTDITGLSENTKYYFKIFEYNENTCSNSQGYKTDGFGTKNPVWVKTLPTNISDYPIGDGEIYVGNSTSHVLTVYNASDNGNVTPKRTIFKTFPNIWFGGITIYDDIIFITNYIWNILETKPYDFDGVYEGGENTPFGPVPSPLSDPRGITFDSDGLMYICNDVYGTLSIESYIGIYAKGDRYSELGRIKATGTAILENPGGIAVDDNYIYVNNGPRRQILVFNKGEYGDVEPVRIIGGNKTGLEGAGALAIDNGYIYVNVGWPHGKVLVFKTTDDGNVAPQRMIGGSNTYLNDPSCVYVSGNYLYITNTYSGNSVCIFNKTDNGNIPPIRLIKGSYTLLDEPSVVYATGSYDFPIVVDLSISDITATSALGTADVYNAGGGTISARGVCWKTTGSPDISSDHSTESGGTGSFTSSLTGLSPGTTYYARAYATNEAGTAYSDEVTFTTPDIPHVTTADITGITTTTATGGGNVTSEGSSSVTSRGICWGSSTNPDLYAAHTTDGSGTGTFTSSLTGLTSGSTYHVRAYATNSLGTAYGNDVAFTTNGTVLNVVTLNVTDIKTHSANVSAEVTDDGGHAITERGVCLSESENPVKTDNHSTSSGTTGTFSVDFSGLSCGTSYHVRAYTTNASGTAYGADLTFTTLNIASQPENQTTDLIFTNVTQTSATISWSDGGGSKRILFRKTTEFGSDDYPRDGNEYTTGRTYNDMFVCGIYDGSVSTATFTDLTANTVYYFKMFEFSVSSCPNSESYKINGFDDTNPVSVKTAPNQITNLVVRSVSRTFIAIQWSRGNGTGCIALCLKGTSSDVINPEYGTANYSANSNYGSGDHLGTGTSSNYIVYKGTGNTLRVDGLTKNTQYTFKVYEYNLYNSYYSYATNITPLSRNTSPKEGYDPEWADSPGSRLLSVRINPIPANEVLNLALSLEESANITIELFNMEGQNVGTHCNVSLPVNSSYQKGQYELPISIGNLASGSYYLVVSGNNEVVIQDFVIMR